MHPERKAWKEPLPLLVFLGLAYAVQAFSVWLETSGAQHPGRLRYPRIYAPAAIALIVAYLAYGRGQASSLLSSLLRWRVPLWAYAFALCYPGAVALICVALLTWTGVSPSVEFDFHAATLWSHWRLVLQISLVEEIVWVGFVLLVLRKRWRLFHACAVMGVLWSIWYFPLIDAGIQVVPGLPTLPVMVNFVVVAAFCGWVYDRTKSALVVAIMQVSTNMTALVVPVLPEHAGMTGYKTFVGLKLLFIVALYLVAGPRPLFGRHRSSSNGSGSSNASSSKPTPS